MATAKRKAPSTKNKGTPVPVPTGTRGRPSAYKEEYVELARRLVYLDSNATDESLASFFGVGLATFRKWKSSYPSFSDAIAHAKRPADATVANALLRRALGYDYEEVVPIKVKEGGNDVIKMVTVRKHLAGDVTAQSLWLRNRQSAIWKANPEDSGGEDTSISNISVSVQHSPHAKPVGGEGNR